MYLQTTQGIGQSAATTTPARAVRNPVDGRAKAIITAVQNASSPTSPGHDSQFGTFFITIIARTLEKSRQ